MTSTPELLAELQAAIEENRFRAARQLFAKTRRQQLTGEQNSSLKLLITTLPLEEQPVFNPMSTKERDEIEKGFSLNVETLNAEEFLAFAQQVLRGTIPNPQNISLACLLLVAETAELVEPEQVHALEADTFTVRLAKFMQMGLEEDYRLSCVSLQHLGERALPDSVDTLAWAIELFTEDGFVWLLAAQQDDPRGAHLFEETVKQLHFLSGTKAFEGFDTSRPQKWVSELHHLGYKGEALAMLSSVIAMPISQATAETLLKAEPLSRDAFLLLSDQGIFRPTKPGPLADFASSLAGVMEMYGEVDEALSQLAQKEGGVAPSPMVAMTPITQSFSHPMFEGYQEGILFLLDNPKVCRHCLPEDAERLGPDGWLNLRSVGLMVNRNLAQAKAVLTFELHGVSKDPRRVATICISAAGAVSASLMEYFLEDTVAQFAAGQISAGQLIGERLVSTDPSVVLEMVHTDQSLEKLVLQIETYLMRALQSLSVYHQCA